MKSNNINTETEYSSGYSVGWGIRMLPGLFVMVLILLARALGLLESLELLTFDYFLKLRPLEGPDDRITIITISKEDIQRWGGYPIANQKITDVIETIQQYQPTVIGLNLLKDVMEDDPQDLITLFQKYDNIVIAEKILPPQIRAFPNIPENQIGFIDISLDRDDSLRRGFLGNSNPTNLDEFKFSFSIHLTEKYLSRYGYKLENGIKKTEAMRFGMTEIPLLNKNFGGYIRIDDGGIQTLISFKNHSQPFFSLSVHEIETKKIPDNLFGNKVVLIGLIDLSTRSQVPTVMNRNSSFSKSGIYFQAHAISQIISAVLDQRPLLHTWNEPIEYGWILIWGGLSIYLALWNPKERIWSLTFKLIFLLPMILSYVLLLQGYWIVWIPQILIFLMNSIIYAILTHQEEIVIHIENMKFEQKQIIQKEKLRLKQQKRLQEEEIKNKEIIERHLKQSIEKTFTIIHNGPLQDLAILIRDVRDQTIHDDFLIDRLVSLDRSIRDLGDQLKSSEGASFYLGGDQKIDLDLPIHEMFYEVFRKTLSRDFTAFKSIKVKLRSFVPMPANYDLDVNLKGELCHFLTEMLCNVAKHASGCSRLVAIGELEGTSYCLMVMDNGAGIQSNHQGQGTSQAQQLAKRLSGTFTRKTTDGRRETCCKLSWPLNRNGYTTGSSALV